jgi:hypothetical protein
MATVQQQIAAVTNYTLEYFQQWRRAAAGEFATAAARLLLAAGRGPARPLSCEQTLRHIRVTATVNETFAAEALVLRAVALLCPGELRTLRVADPTILAFILSAVVQQDRDEGASSVLASLRAIEWESAATEPRVAFTLLGRYASNIIELNCPLQRRCEAADSLLASCTRLEVLTHTQHYARSAWLQLSQLHTLQNVDLSVVSTSAIAAALPRLHTLGVVSPPAGVPAAAVAGFFEDLLPRLQVFQFLGYWPQNLDTHDDAASSTAPQPLPHLRSLKLHGLDGHAPPWMGFIGARPLEFLTDDVVMIERWLALEDHHRDGDAAASTSASGVVCCPLGSVRTLQIAVRSLCSPPDAAQLLRAAPHLETLTVSVFASDVDVDSSWLRHPAFDGLVHSKLKRIVLSGLRSIFPFTSDCLLRLRHLHFPRLRGVTIDRREYLVTPLELPSFTQRLVNRVARFAAIYDGRGKNSAVRPFFSEMVHAIPVTRPQTTHADDRPQFSVNK